MMWSSKTYISFFALFFFSAIGFALGIWWNLDQTFYALLIIFISFFITWIDLYFSLLLLLFATQFFIGDFHRPYMYLLNIFGLILSIGWLFKSISKKKQIKFPHWWLILPFFTILILSFPLNLKEIFLDFKVLGFNSFIKSIAASNTFSREYWLRDLFGNFVSFGIFLSIFNILRPKKGFAKDIWFVLALSLVNASLVGLLLLYGLIPIKGQFLSINFGGSRYFKGMLTSYGWSVSFFAEYFAATYPFVFVPVLSSKGKFKKFGLLILTLLTLFAVMKTYRKTIFLIISIETIFAVIFFYFFYLQKRNLTFNSLKSAKIIITTISIFFVLGTTFAVFLKVTKNSNQYIKKELEKKYTFESLKKDPRLGIFKLCYQISKYEPVLGIGPGGYTQYFFKFGGGNYLKTHNINLPDGRVLNKLQGSPHSSYLKILIENGVLGVLTFLWMIGGFLFFSIKALKKLENREMLFLFTVMLGVGGILLYGLFMDFLWIPAMRFLFWAYLAILAVETEAIVPKIRFSKKTASITILILLSLLVYRLYLVKSEDVRTSYEVGFYRWESSRKGDKVIHYRFTSSHALKVLLIENGQIDFQICSNKPDISVRPQTVNIYINGKLVKTIFLNDRNWRKITIPVPHMRGQKIFMDIQVGGTWVPSKYGRGKSRRELGVIITKICS